MTVAFGFKASYGLSIQSGSGNPHGRHLGSGSDRDADAFRSGYHYRIERLSANDSGKRTLILWRVEAKLDLLDPYKSLPPGVVEALQRGEKIRAIKFHREATGVGLKEAKDFVEEVQRRGSP